MENAYIPPDALREVRARLNEYDRAIVDLITLTGYRIDDILFTRVCSWAGAEVTLCERKTGHLRTLKITTELRQVINTINRKNKPDGQRKRSPLAYFIPTTRRIRKGCRHKIHRTTIYRHFEQAVREAGFEGCGYTIHSLRKVYAHDQYKKTGSLLAVQRDLGHKHLETTILYALGDQIRL